MDPTTDAKDAKDGNCGCDCTTALDRLYLFLDKEIDTASCTEIQQHIEDCAPCMSAYDVERIVKSLVHRSCTETAPETLVQKVKFAIRTVEVRFEG
jgi:mycothiol system anti-sigma-R factor